MQNSDALSRTVAAIMAGGAGTRFWPASRRSRPKPFIPLVGGKPLLASTVERLQPPLGPDQVYLVLGARLAERVPEVLPGFPEEQLLLEPIPRNTLGAVLLATARARVRGEDSLVAILPADHYVPDPEIFRDDLLDAVTLADEGYLVTMGIRPTSPETGYGYIQASDRFLGDRAILADRFVEKPDRHTAERYLADGRFYWNSGMFFFRQDRILEELQQANPQWPGILDRMCEALAGPADSRSEKLKEALLALPNTSIDYAVMERATRIALLPARYRWSDVGAWDTVAALQSGDRTQDQGTILVGSENCHVLRTDQAPVVALVGMENCIVAATDDALLVIRRGQGQRVREVVEVLKERGMDTLL